MLAQVAAHLIAGSGSCCRRSAGGSFGPPAGCPASGPGSPGPTEGGLRNRATRASFPQTERPRSCSARSPRCTRRTRGSGDPRRRPAPPPAASRARRRSRCKVGVHLGVDDRLDAARIAEPLLGAGAASGGGMRARHVAPRRSAPDRRRCASRRTCRSRPRPSPRRATRRPPRTARPPARAADTGHQAGRSSCTSWPKSSKHRRSARRIRPSRSAVAANPANGSSPLSQGNCSSFSGVNHSIPPCGCSSQRFRHSSARRHPHPSPGGAGRRSWRGRARQTTRQSGASRADHVVVEARRVGQDHQDAVFDARQRGDRLTRRMLPHRRPVHARVSHGAPSRAQSEGGVPCRTNSSLTTRAYARTTGSSRSPFRTARCRASSTGPGSPSCGDAGLGVERPDPLGDLLHRPRIAEAGASGASPASGTSTFEPDVRISVAGSRPTSRQAASRLANRSPSAGVRVPDRVVGVGVLGHQSQHPRPARADPDRRAARAGAARPSTQSSRGSTCRGT